MSGTDGTSEEEVKFRQQEEKERGRINRTTERADTEECPRTGAMQKESVGPDKTVFNSFPERTTLSTSGIDEQVQFLSKQVPGLSEQQARSILEKGFNRDSSIVFGGSRVRGGFNSGSDIDVGFDGLTERQTQRVVNQLNKLGGGLKLEDDIRIAPGVETPNIPKIQSPEEFFQRSGIRSSRDPKAGQPFVPSGSITVKPNGEIIIIPPRK